MELKSGWSVEQSGTEILLIAPLMELKWYRASPLFPGLITFNRTAYGIEIAIDETVYNSIEYF